MTAGYGDPQPPAGGVEPGLLDTTSFSRLAEEQAALRRVARLVAHGAAPSEIFLAVAGEVGELLRADVVHLARYEHDGIAVALAGWAREGETLPAGAEHTLYRAQRVR